MKHLKPIIKIVKKYYKFYLAAAAVVSIIGLTLAYKLGTLIGMSPAEQSVSGAPIGWTGILSDPLFFPLLVLRSAVFWVSDTPGAFVTRLPNLVMGLTAVAALTLVVRAWHGNRIALITGALFLASAWTLHVSRYASNDVAYLALLPVLIAAQTLLMQRAKSPAIVACLALTYSALTLIPGGIWFVLLSLFWQRKLFKAILALHTSIKRRLTFALAAILPLALLATSFVRGESSILTWLGLPNALPDPVEFGHDLLAVPAHLFVFGPNIPELWLGRSPILSVFVLAMAIIGIFFYAVRNFSAGRSRMLLSFGVIGWILIALQGPVLLSLLVPLLYFAAAAGIAYLLRDWFKMFPVNPFARSVGIVLIIAASLVSISYDLQRYYIAWPASPQTQQAFTQESSLIQ